MNNPNVERAYVITRYFCDNVHDIAEFETFVCTLIHFWGERHGVESTVLVEDIKGAIETVPY